MSEKELKIEAGKTRSLWLETSVKTSYPKKEKDKEIFDEVIIGGGIAGLSSAYFLAKAGKKVAVLDMNRIASGVTGFTTAKITSLHGLRYSKIIKNFGKEKAKIYAGANQAALEKISEIIELEKIECDFGRATAYTFTEQEKNLKRIKDEVRAGNIAGLKTYFTSETDLLFKIKGAVALDDQAFFHPRRYLVALAKIIEKNGGKIFENTKVLDVAEGDPCTVITEGGEIKGENIILATNFPMKDTGRFFARLYPYYSYAIALTINGFVPDGLYWSPDDRHYSIRSHRERGKEYLIVGGANHRTGQGGNTLKQYEEVLNFAKNRFDIKSVDYYWSTMDYRTSDGAPFIGRAPKMKQVYLATGFNAWGMTTGTLAGMLITDLILGKENKAWANFFDPGRSDSLNSAIEFGKENANVTGQLSKKYFLRQKNKPEDLNSGEGGVFKENGTQKAFYKDEAGKIHSIPANCTHMGCIVNWNNAEKTWDCPCHGSRFSKDGKVIHGPAIKDLD